MSELELENRISQKETTAVGSFMALRGRLLKKQFHDIGVVRDNHLGKVTVQTLIFSVPNASPPKQTFGVKITHEDHREREESCLVDFDELRELLLGIKFLFGLIRGQGEKSDDYVEYQYATRDGLKTGIYQSEDGSLGVFFDVQPGGGMAFLSVENYQKIFDLIKSGMKHLAESGAKSEGTA